MAEDQVAALPSLAEIKLIPVSQLQPNRWNRRIFDSEALKEFASQVKRVGVLEALTVRPLGQDRYEIASGNRRWEAAKLAGLSEVTCIVKPLSDQQVSEMNISSNIEREDVPPLELARMVRSYMDEFHKSQEETALEFNKSQAWVSDLTSFLSISPPVLQIISALIIPFRVLQGFKRLQEDQQSRVAEDLKLGVIGLPELETRIQRLLRANQKKKAQEDQETKPRLDPLRESWPPEDARIAQITYKGGNRWSFEITAESGKSQENVAAGLGQLAAALGWRSPSDKTPLPAQSVDPSAVPIPKIAGIFYTKGHRIVLQWAPLGVGFRYEVHYSRETETPKWSDLGCGTVETPGAVIDVYPDGHAEVLLAVAALDPTGRLSEDSQPVRVKVNNLNQSYALDPLPAEFMKGGDHVAD